MTIEIGKVPGTVAEQGMGSLWDELERRLKLFSKENTHPTCEDANYLGRELQSLFNDHAPLFVARHVNISFDRDSLPGRWVIHFGVAAGEMLPLIAALKETPYPNHYRA